MLESLSEINKKYDGEWIFAINCKEDEFGELLEGEVVIHSKRRDDVYREMFKFQHVPTPTAIRYVGKIPDGVNLVL